MFILTRNPLLTFISPLLTVCRDTCNSTMKWSFRHLAWVIRYFLTCMFYICFAPCGLLELRIYLALLIRIYVLSARLKFEAVRILNFLTVTSYSCSLIGGWMLPCPSSRYSIHGVSITDLVVHILFVIAHILSRINLNLWADKYMQFCMIRSIDDHCETFFILDIYF